jgi:hypothetical protein
MTHTGPVTSAGGPRQPLVDLAGAGPGTQQPTPPSAVPRNPFDQESGETIGSRR